MTPVDYLRNRVQSWQAHPFQQIASAVGGAFGGPGVGFGLNQLFNRYNDRAFNQAANASYGHGEDLGSQAQATALDKPLNGPLGKFSNDQSRALASALTGNGGGYGGPTQGPGGWNYGNYLGWNPHQADASQTFGLLDFLGPQPPHTNPDARRNADMGQGGMTPMPGLYGVSNFNVMGSPVINGIRPSGGDMNQAYLNGRF